ncbi:MAG: hypothetical protein J5I93_29615 [Pirellulaceae bacterium]|nr:hypothetical protein [Pirellulaceae bacterium]
MAQNTLGTLLERLDGEFVFVILLIGTIFGFVTVMVIATTAMRYYHLSRKISITGELIRDMLARQMSADQIVAVLDSWKASRGGKESARQFFERYVQQSHQPPAKPPKAGMKMPA